MADRGLLYTGRVLTREGLDRIQRGYRCVLHRPMVASVGPYRIEVPGDRLWAFRNGVYYEQDMTRWLPLLLQEAASRVFYDVGANYGYYSLLLAPAADSVHAFEPVSRTRAYLKSALARNKVENVTVHPVALSDHVGSAEIRLYSSSGSNSLYDVDHGIHVRQIGTETVTLETLDRQVYDRGLPPPGLIKMDVEGAELFVLRGARRILREHHPILTIEFLDTIFKKAGYSRSDLVAELTDMGYTLMAISSSGPLRVLAEGDDANNVVAVSTDALDRLQQLAGASQKP
jgi:FkbM family methyltransferase